MRSAIWPIVACVAAIVLVGGMLAFAQDKAASSGQASAEAGERKVTEALVPGPALAALKKLALRAPITELAEEREAGHTLYEGSWMGEDGQVDALVTEAGDVVEIEEALAQDKVPAAVRAAAEQEAGKGAQIVFERKTTIRYQAHFKRDAQAAEVVLTADGRRR